MDTLAVAVGWIIVIAFGVTFIVTILALTNAIKLPGRYLPILFTKLVLEIIAGAFFLFYRGVEAQTPPYTGEWNGYVAWEDSWAQKLFNGNNTPGFALANPRSEGVMYLYKARSGNYRAFSQWELRNGEDAYAKVVVTANDFEFDAKGKLTEMDVRAEFRKPLREFVYGPSITYHWKFDKISDTELHGKVFADSGEKATQVGTITLHKL